MHNADTVKRFMSQTRRCPDTGCLLWEGPRMYSHRAGGRKVLSYGTFRVNRTDKPRTAHAVAWEIANGRPVPDGMVVRHLVCDNPQCVEKTHLAVGTPAENAQDMLRKRRWESGQNAHRWIQVGEVRRTATEWARVCGVAPQTVFNRLRRGWDEVAAATTPSGISRGEVAAHV